jgi:hypothetical protein
MFTDAAAERRLNHSTPVYIRTGDTINERSYPQIEMAHNLIISSGKVFSQGGHGMIMAEKIT